MKNENIFRTKQIEFLNKIRNITKNFLFKVVDKNQRYRKKLYIFKTKLYFVIVKIDNCIKQGYQLKRQEDYSNKTKGIFK